MSAMKPDLPERLLAEARQHAPVAVERSRLMPLREALLTFRAKRLSYEKIATVLKGHGVAIQASALGHFCRRYCPAPEIERVRHQLVAAVTGAPMPAHAAMPPTAPPPPPPSASAKRRGPRIARDDL
jgi:hypothetical protein